MSAVEGKPARVLVVGGGFGGRDAAKRLAYRLPRGSEIILIDRNEYMIYTPMLTEVAGRSISAGRIRISHDKLPSRVRFVRGEIVDADVISRTVTLQSGEVLSGDHILFALGSSTNFRNVNGAERFSFTMKTLKDAQHLQRQAEHCVRSASRMSVGDERKRLCTFVVAGGGYTGVETITALNDLVRDTARQHAVPSFELQVILIESSKRIMSEMPEELAEYTEWMLRRDGIEVRTGVGVQSVTESELTLTNGQKIRMGTLIWDTGIEPNPLVASFDCQKGEKHGILVDSAFQVLQRPGVWAIGDCAEIPKPDGGGTFFEPTAQNATREGTHVADNIVATIRGRSVKPFRYRQVGELAVVSRHAGVAHVFGFRIQGLFAWLMWRMIYVAKLPSIVQRLGVLLDWGRLAFGKRYVPSTSHATLVDGKLLAKEPAGSLL